MLMKEMSRSTAALKVPKGIDMHALANIEKTCAAAVAKQTWNLQSRQQHDTKGSTVCSDGF